MSRYPARLTLAVLAVLALVALPAASRLAAQGKGTIKIATQSPLSGGQAALGEGIKLGAQLAIEKFKGNLEKLGYKVELVPFDDQAKPDVGVANAKNIIADKDIMADRPSEFGRGHSLVRGLQGSPARDDLAREHEPDRHGPRLRERQPRLRP